MEKQTALVADDIVVGEGVALDVPVASPLLRVGSAAIDYLLTILATVATFALFYRYILFSDQAIARIVQISILVFYTVFLPTLVETFTNGKSLGRLAFGTRVVRTDHGAISFRHAFTRSLVSSVEIWTTGGFLALAFIIFTKQSVRLGDLAAGTIVVKDRLPLQLTTPVQMPEQMSSWAAAVDIGTIPTPLALSARQFLLRANGLSAQTREAMALDIARKLQTYVYPLPAQTPHPEVFIAAVLAERSKRALHRAEANARLTQSLLKQG